MSSRAVYLAKYGPKSSRGHFAIFVPNLKYNSNTLETDWRKGHCVGTIIHVVGEPLMAGFALEFKRNYDCFLSTGLLKLLLLGAINDTYLFQLDSDKIVREAVPRCLVETISSKVRPPPKGQDIRAPIDGVSIHFYYTLHCPLNLIHCRSRRSVARNGRWSSWLCWLNMNLFMRTR